MMSAEDPRPANYLLSINTDNGDSVLVGPYRKREICEADRRRIDGDIRALDLNNVDGNRLVTLRGRRVGTFIRQPHPGHCCQHGQRAQQPGA